METSRKSEISEIGQTVVKQTHSCADFQAAFSFSVKFNLETPESLAVRPHGVAWKILRQCLHRRLYVNFATVRSLNWSG